MSSLSAVNILPQGAPFSRRLGAWLYDMFVLFAVEMLAVGFIIATLMAFIEMGFSIEGYKDAGDYLTRNPVVSPFFTFYIFSIAASFYAFFWCHSTGQTIGMKTWKLKIVSQTGGKISLTQALIRCATACFGLGNFLVLFDNKNRAFQDYLSNSQVIKIN